MGRTRQRSFYAPDLSPADRRRLARASREVYLADEIGLVRLWAARLLKGMDLSAGGVGVPAWMLVRLLELLRRMATVQAKVGVPVEDELAKFDQILAQRRAAAAPEEDYAPWGQGEKELW